MRCILLFLKKLLKYIWKHVVFQYYVVKLKTCFYWSLKEIIFISSIYEGIFYEYFRKNKKISPSDILSMCLDLAYIDNNNKRTLYQRQVQARDRIFLVTIEVFFFFSGTLKFIHVMHNRWIATNNHGQLVAWVVICNASIAKDEAQQLTSSLVLWWVRVDFVFLNPNITYCS